MSLKPLEFSNLCYKKYDDGSGEQLCEARGAFGFRVTCWKTPDEGYHATGDYMGVAVVYGNSQKDLEKKVNEIYHNLLREWITDA